jgi:hypothetical protein
MGVHGRRGAAHRAKVLLIYWSVYLFVYFLFMWFCLFLFIYLFTENLTTLFCGLDYVASNNRMINELDKIRKEAVVV